ncbi:hydroxyacylglutathione hydrolase [Trametes coccinea BRFM310]|uniref:hydroxyacylglutathione hydrolase n=1 Tax=Trametes coccinea (strain BRFM310) TaxID=1353009 RepID=A0A1Y2IKH8_TRAC3|nr:hydroxyacylglutathione hydrolase [Trametes coccinea BRFM310]
MLFALSRLARSLSTPLPPSPLLSRSFVSTPVRNMKVVPVPVRDDNYAYLLIDDATNKAAAVDPYDVPKVKAAAEKEGVQIIAALTTHHHFDHSGGNKAFAEAFPDAPIYGGSDKIPALTNPVKDKDEFNVANIHVRCLATPCHTQDSICYYATDKSGAGAPHPGTVFTGDTLFVAGCGRFFEGTGAEMHAALTYLGTLPAETVVHDGHEYTKGNLAFAKHVDPENPALARLEKLIKDGVIPAQRTTIGDEKEWNPFMRLDSSPIQKATGGGDPASVMDALRTLKNNFRG